MKHLIEKWQEKVRNLQKLIEKHKRNKDYHNAACVDAQLIELKSCIADAQNLKSTECAMNDVVGQSEQLVCQVAKRKGTKECGLHNLHCEHPKCMEKAN